MPAPTTTKCTRPATTSLCAMATTPQIAACWLASIRPRRQTNVACGVSVRARWSFTLSRSVACAAVGSHRRGTRRTRDTSTIRHTFRLHQSQCRGPCYYQLNVLVGDHNRTLTSSASYANKRNEKQSKCETECNVQNCCCCDININIFEFHIINKSFLCKKIFLVSLRNSKVVVLFDESGFRALGGAAFANTWFRRQEPLNERTPAINDD
jgi:hypothetical protein